MVRKEKMSLGESGPEGCRGAGFFLGGIDGDTVVFFLVNVIFLRNA